MPLIPEKPFLVEIREYERGWGSKTDEIEGFDTKPEAIAFMNEFNAKNTEDVVPDWYMVAMPYNF